MERFCDCLHPDCHVCKVCNMYEEENSKLREELKLANYNLEQTRDCLLYERNRLNLANELHEAAEAKLKAASEQEPVAYMHPSGGVLRNLDVGLERETYTIKLYTAPVPPVDVQGLKDMIEYLESYVESQKESFAEIAEGNIELQRKLAEQQALFYRINTDPDWAKHGMLDGNEEFTALIAQAQEGGRKDAVPDVPHNSLRFTLTFGDKHICQLISSNQLSQTVLGASRLVGDIVSIACAEILKAESKS